jgi:hypothetical protein
MALIDGKQLRDGSVTDAKLATPAGRPTKDNKFQAASTTVADFDLATATAIAHTPKGTVEIDVNGAGQNLGDGVKTADCYFSGDGGTTARTIANIVSGDLLYWVGSVAGFQLAAATDRVSFIYNA